MLPPSQGASALQSPHTPRLPTEAREVFCCLVFMLISGYADISPFLLAFLISFLFYFKKSIVLSQAFLYTITIFEKFLMISYVGELLPLPSLRVNTCISLSLNIRALRRFVQMESHKWDSLSGSKTLPFLQYSS